MIRSSRHCIKSSATKDLREACAASGEMYNRGTFSEDTKAVPNYLLNGAQKKEPSSFREASDDSGLQDTVLERG